MGKVFISIGGVYKAVIASLPRILFFFFLVAHPPRENKTFLIPMSHVGFGKTSRECERGSGKAVTLMCRSGRDVH